MRSLAAVSLLLLGACPGPGGGGPGAGGECFVDEECILGEVCARDDLCWPEAEVRAVRTTWTVRGLPADETTCARFPDLHIVFDGNVRDTLGFQPVPCANGQFFIDKLPRPFTRVDLGIDNTRSWETASIGATGMASLDLTF